MLKSLEDMNHVIHVKSWGSAHRSPTLVMVPCFTLPDSLFRWSRRQYPLAQHKHWFCFLGVSYWQVAPIYSIVEEFQTPALECHFERIPRTTLRFLSDAFCVEVSAGSGRHTGQNEFWSYLGKPRSQILRASYILH
jgi:hypothetical protein